MERIVLILDLTEECGGSDRAKLRKLTSRIMNTVSAVSQLDTAWLRLVIELPDEAQVFLGHELLGDIEDRYWVRLSFGDARTQLRRRLHHLRDFDANGLGFVKGSELFPREAVFKWSRAKKHCLSILEEEGAVLVSLPGATIISDQRVIQNVHYAGIAATTVVFFAKEKMEYILAIERSRWFSEFVCVSCFGADHILIVTPDQDFRRHFSSEKSLKPLTDEILDETLSSFSASKEDFLRRVELDQ